MSFAPSASASCPLHRITVGRRCARAAGSGKLSAFPVCNNSLTGRDDGRLESLYNPSHFAVRPTKSVRDPNSRAESSEVGIPVLSRMIEGRTSRDRQEKRIAAY